MGERVKRKERVSEEREKGALFVLMMVNMKKRFVFVVSGF